MLDADILVSTHMLDIVIAVTTRISVICNIVAVVIITFLLFSQLFLLLIS